jgi:cytochrome c biogenesis protein CcdA
MNRILLLLICLLTALFSFAIAQPVASNTSAKSPVQVLVFIRDGCAHCQKEEQFFRDLVRTRQEVSVQWRNLSEADSRRVWDEFTSSHALSKVTPITIIGDYYVVGFDKPETTGAMLIQLIDEVSKTGAKPNLQKAKPFGLSQSSCDESGLVPCMDRANQSLTLSLPIFGTIDSSAYPLAVLAAILGFFDGFNPCAMWVLVTFLVILAQVGDRRRMFLFVGTFILAEALMYYLILTIWHRTWDFVKLDAIVTPAVGIASIIGGIFFLREWRKKELACKVANPRQQAKTVDRIKHLASKPFTLVTFLGVLGVAFSVNIVEFACSVGIPQAFTKILEINDVSFLESQIFIGIYILMYMVDDLIVFAFAFFSFNKLLHTQKYARLSNLIGGVILILLGIVMIARPSLLRF